MCEPPSVVLTVMHTSSLKNHALFVTLCLTLGGVACSDDTAGSGAGSDGDDTSTTSDSDTDPSDSESDTQTGDGDGDDPSGDGDGDDPSGDGDGDDPSGDGDGDDPPVDPYACIGANWLNGGPEGHDYSQTGIVLGSHCLGTDHQDITGIERVVFIGDSVTVGSPPTPTEDFYRAQLADDLAMKFDLVAPSILWATANPITGQALIQEDGDFASCAEWGARTDDFFGGGEQIASCFSGDDFNKTTLVVTTMGGNDIAAIAKDAIEGAVEDALWDDAESMLQHQRDMVHWFVDDPEKFPNGVYVVYANVYEFTDATVDLLSCPAAGAAGFDQNPPDPEFIVELMTYINTEYALLSAETQTDMILMFENFCGHGFHSDNPASPCYRGPGQENWFDLTCIHPTPEGHGEVANWFFQTIDE